jgi:hypothetical protein
VSSADKVLDSMRNNPRDWRIEHIQAVASRYGFSWRQNGTSHVTFRAPDGATLPIPAARPVKPVYVRRFLGLIDRMRGEAK